MTLVSRQYFVYGLVYSNVRDKNSTSSAHLHFIHSLLVFIDSKLCQYISWLIITERTSCSFSSRSWKLGIHARYFFAHIKKHNLKCRYQLNFTVAILNVIFIRLWSFCCRQIIRGNTGSYQIQCTANHRVHLKTFKER